MTNFTNGALVFRVWQFDGSGEVIAKTQYRGDAEEFARMKAKDDAQKRPSDIDKWFYVVVCEYENSMQAFRPAKFV